MSREHCATLYDLPSLYDAVVVPGPCESFYRKLACSTGGPILELACGTGRLTIPLALEGHEVVGLDASYPMLRAARAKAEAKRAKVEFVLGDMRRFDLGRYFALVIVSCNSLAHITANEDIVECLSRIARHLVPGGLLAFDVVNPSMRDLAQCGHTAERSETEPDRSYVSGSKELIAYDPVQQVQILKWRFEALGRKIPPVAPMRLRAYFPQEMPLRLALAGLELAARYGDFDGRRFIGSSPNQIYVARAARNAS
ncbi:MAG: class I SAM-dependent methyltransferase [Mesorhizobium sp.]|uniref:class I SAM-dependent methyltransferase n=1 Tax=Mesorhizobium sp. TaxID=1871066 RepID=UPI000FE7AF5C|nr:class I SAM-dependent methyltransferase [Mesorhizobium sp.]RWD47231.1 MAG: class I SAM-dependent methyltransferase [Mesorhizobium sp.]RWE61645.1 MAG: class I SAM-dependent methyltransferase [Mesorhizobium sp.]RWF13379.1 MAG: class I SAM-dependent methyltransferase [Mesorhizobium sp.]RWF22824.1 MAG: class I SAM-dependent methyltransferase [Mesorhizobium sp.]TIW47600.1 MAG: class I SAM-dependent methyltransferase [Mesorhizobium sp.]